MSGEFAELYRAIGLPEADALRLRLEHEGIRVRIDDDVPRSGDGEPPADRAGKLRVLVNSAQLAAARTILDDFLRPQSEEDAAARCLACRAPMGEADTCPACGWSFAPDPDAPPDPDRDVSSAVEPTPALSTSPESEVPPAPAEASPPAGPALPRDQLWWELAAVLAVWVIPQLSGAILPRALGPVPPYWADSVDLTVVSGCAAFVTLYLVRRAGEPWARFGITRFRPLDILITIALLLALVVAWVLMACLALPSGPSHDQLFPSPRGRWDYLMMAVKYGVAAFAEEVICRAYLIVRLRDLLRSRGAAVLLAAALFASYHLYLGVGGAVGAFLVGLIFGAAFLVVPRIWPLVLAHALWNVRTEMITVATGG
ncbi:MAG TPA: CPBP family glutamic-type intramembrane protease [Gemmataceae bacterium]|nr:CPBP family glutamic-type intramembrane protease [Gemmataceae bacterium]